MDLKAAVVPETEDPARRDYLVQSLKNARVDVVAPEEANAIIWLDVNEVEGLKQILAANESIEWVQLPFAGVEAFHAAGLFEHSSRFTCAKGAYGEQVGEAALALTLACLRNLGRHSRHHGWQRIEPESLFDKRVTIVGAGGIAETLIALLAPFGVDVSVVRRSSAKVDGVKKTVTTADLDSVLPETDVLILALALTPETEGLIAAEQLQALPQNAVVVNVARGGHIVTDDLVDALNSGHIAAAALDVTDPEPLPDDHPLWDMDNVIITSHCADSKEFVTRKLNYRILENVRALQNDEPLVGEVDPRAGY